MLHCHMTQWIFCSLLKEANLIVLMYPLLYMYHLMQHTKHMLVYPFLSQTDMLHRGIWNIEPSCIIIIRVTWSADIKYIWYKKVLFFVFFWGRGMGPMWPNINLTLSFIVVGGGWIPMPCHYTYLLQAFPDKKKWKKINMNSDIGLSTLTFIQMPLQGGRSELWSTGPPLVAVFATRCLCQSSLHVCTTLFSVLCSKWNLGVHILGDIAKIGWASNNCRCTHKN